MGLNRRVLNLIKVILDPTDSGDPSRLTGEIDLVLSGQRVSGKWRQRQELPRLRAFFWATQVGYVVGDTDYWVSISGLWRRNSRVLPSRKQYLVAIEGFFPHVLHMLTLMEGKKKMLVLP